MKFFRKLVAGCVIVLATSVGTQSSPAPNNAPNPAAVSDTEDAAAEPSPSPSPSVSIEPPSLIPPNTLPGPGAAALPKVPAAADLQMLNALFKQSSLGKLADERRLHLQMVKLESRIRNDADLQVARAAADKVSTDLERRKLLRQYYHQYYSRLRAMADTPDLKTYLDGQETAHIAVLAQPRVRPDTNPVPAGVAAKPLPTPVQARARNVLRHP